MGTPYHGLDGLIYISGTEISGANAWDISIATDSVETTEFGDTWKGNKPGLIGWSGSISAQDHTDISVIFDVVATGEAHALMIYPDKGDTTDYYSGNAIFGWGSSGSTTSSVMKTADFVGDGALTQTGFS